MSANTINSLITSQTDTSLARMVNFINEAIVVFSSSGTIEIINSLGAKLLGARRPDLLGENIIHFIGEESHALRSQIIRVANQPEADIKLSPCEVTIIRCDGKTAVVDLSISSFTTDSQSESRYYFCVMHDLTSHKAEYNILQQRAITDHVTGLYNRQHFNELLERHWLAARRDIQPLSLLLIDVDFFKTVNDTYGHLAGDKCLRKIAETIQLSLPHREAAAARFGGDEFAVILPDCSGNACQLLAMRIKRHISQLRCEEHNYRNEALFTVSIGLATTEHGQFDSVDSFLDSADKLLYQAKSQGRNQICC